jgi:8-oxo-dGTP diphosphatase
MPPLLVTAAILQREGKTLLTRRPEGTRHGGLWEFPGGKLDPGESPQEGLQREIREELGLEIRVGEIFDVVYHRYDWGAILLLAYRCEPLGGEIRNLQVAEHRWVDPAELGDYPILPADRPLIARLQRQGGA